MSSVYKKPVVKGPVDGNIFAVMGAAASAMKRSKVDSQHMTTMYNRVKKSKSYEEALSVICEYVTFRL
jgi:hypothetical protein